MKKLKIIYEDKDILIVSKEPKMLTISDNKGHQNLYEEVSSYVKKQNKNNKIFIVHRLDKDTSGLVLFAKSKEIKELLQASWQNVERKYLAIVEGIPLKKENRLINNLSVTKTNLVYVSKKGKEAITIYKVIKSNKRYSLLDVLIETGRQNQIRVQLSYIGNPIVGDKKYGAKTNPLNRLGLHAYYLKFRHPKDGKEMEFTLSNKEFMNFIK